MRIILFPFLTDEPISKQDILVNRIFKQTAALLLASTALTSSALTSPATTQLAEGIAISQGVLSLFPDTDVQGVEMGAVLDMLNGLHEHIDALGDGMKSIIDLLKAMEVKDAQIPDLTVDKIIIRDQIGYSPVVLEKCGLLDTVKPGSKEDTYRRREAVDYLKSRRGTLEEQRKKLFASSQLSAGVWVEAMVTEANLIRHLPYPESYMRKALAEYDAKLLEVEDETNPQSLVSLVNLMKGRQRELRKNLAELLRTKDETLPDAEYRAYSANTGIEIVTPHFEFVSNYSLFVTLKRTEAAGGKDLYSISYETRTQESRLGDKSAFDPNGIERLRKRDLIFITEARERLQKIESDVKLYNDLTKSIIPLQKLRAQAAAARALAISWDPTQAESLAADIDPMAGYNAIRDAQDAEFDKKARDSQHALDRAREEDDAAFSEASRHVSEALAAADKDRWKVIVGMFLRQTALTMQVKALVDRYHRQQTAVSKGEAAASIGGEGAGKKKLPHSSVVALVDPKDTPTQDPPIKVSPISYERIETLLKREKEEIDNIHDADSDAIGLGDALSVELDRTLWKRQQQERAAGGDGNPEADAFLELISKTKDAAVEGAVLGRVAVLADVLLYSPEAGDCGPHCSRLPKYRAEADALRQQLLEKHLAHSPQPLRIDTTHPPSPPGR